MGREHRKSCSQMGDGARLPTQVSPAPALRYLSCLTGPCLGVICGISGQRRRKASRQRGTPPACRDDGAMPWHSMTGHPRTIPIGMPGPQHCGSLSFCMTDVKHSLKMSPFAIIIPNYPLTSGRSLQRKLALSQTLASGLVEKSFSVRLFPKLHCRTAPQPGPAFPGTHIGPPAALCTLARPLPLALRTEAASRPAPARSLPQSTPSSGAMALPVVSFCPSRVCWFYQSHGDKG